MESLNWPASLQGTNTSKSNHTSDKQPFFPWSRHILYCSPWAQARRGSGTRRRCRTGTSWGRGSGANYSGRATHKRTCGCSCRNPTRCQSSVDTCCRVEIRMCPRNTGTSIRGCVGCVTHHLGSKSLATTHELRGECVSPRNCAWGHASKSTGDLGGENLAIRGYLTISRHGTGGDLVADIAAHGSDCVNNTANVWQNVHVDFFFYVNVLKGNSY